VELRRRRRGSGRGEGIFAGANRARAFAFRTKVFSVTRINSGRRYFTLPSPTIVSNFSDVKSHFLHYRRSTEYGGSLVKGRRKVRRPFEKGKPIHLVMRSSRAKGAWSFLDRRNKLAIYGLLIEICERYGVKLYQFENVGNHLHLLVKFPGRREMGAFLRVFAQGVMFRVTGARKGDPKGRFFDTIAYSRVMSWGRDFSTVRAYFWKNTLESLGFRREEIDRLRRFNRLVWGGG
jgi:REP element-mobilizing transposase RayT